MGEISENPEDLGIDPEEMQTPEGRAKARLEKAAAALDGREYRSDGDLAKLLTEFEDAVEGATEGKSTEEQERVGELIAQMRSAATESAIAASRAQMLVPGSKEEGKWVKEVQKHKEDGGAWEDRPKKPGSEDEEKSNAEYAKVREAVAEINSILM